MKIEIRNAQIGDVEIVAWTVLTALDMEADNMDKFIKSCSEDDSIYSWRNSIVAVADDKPVGCLVAYDGSRYRELREKSWLNLWDSMDPECLKTTEAETKDGEFYLDSMAILPGYRGLNIGKMLIEFAINKGKCLGCEYATLLVDIDKPRLEAYYHSAGFERFDEMEYFGRKYNRMRYGIIY
ncbi:MAG: GNAT family N-acetyltransferase [Bacteroidales bacterium]|nr:GNAT family N-acetyltransferase [Bacteroidales bacterium]